MPQLQDLRDGVLILSTMVTPRSLGLVKRRANDVRQILVHADMRAQPVTKEKPRARRTGVQPNAGLPQFNLSGD